MQDFILLENPAHNAMLCTVKHTDYWSGFGSKDRATNDPIYLNSYQLSKFGRGYMKIGNKRVTKTWILKSLSSNDFSKCLIFSIDVPLVNSKEITKSRMGFLLRKGKNFFLKQTNRFFCFFNKGKLPPISLSRWKTERDTCVHVYSRTVINQSPGISDHILWYTLKIKLTCQKIILLTSFAKTKHLWQPKWLIQRKKKSKRRIGFFM